MALSASCRFSVSVQLQPPKSNSHRRRPHLLNPNSTNLLAYPHSSRPIHSLRFSNVCNLNTPPSSGEPPNCYDSEEFPLKSPPSNSFLRLLKLSASSSVLFIAACSFVLGFHGAHSPPPALALGLPAPQEQHEEEDKVEEKEMIRATGQKSEEVALEFEDEESIANFEALKTNVIPLAVHLRLVALRASVPPSWIESFVRSQGKRLRFKPRFDASLEGIFSDLSMPFTEGTVKPKSAAAADVVSVSDSWLGLAIKKSIIEPIKGVEDQEWFKGLSERWKIYLRRNHEGEIDPEGKIWAAPYRWGSIVIAYKKSKLQKRNLSPIKDWADLWQPGLAGRISMINCPREVIGAVLKYMGASYNTSNIQLEVTGGKDAVLDNLTSFRKQVQLFDSTHYLKAFGVGDVWVAVGWSSDVIPAAKRMSDVAVVVPTSGASLWADLWAIPAAPSKVNAKELGERVKGPSPMVHQWIEFCLQPARALPFKQEVVPGASPSFLESHQVEEVPKELIKGKPKMETNLVAGVPPPEILAKCEFLEPLSDAALSDYQWLMSGVNKPDLGLVGGMQKTFQSLWQKLPQKVNN